MDKQIDFLPIFDSLDTDIEKSDETCPVCDCEVVRNGRCKTCYYCGWSSCDL